MSLTTASFVLLLLRDKEHPMHNWQSIDTIKSLSLSPAPRTLKPLRIRSNKQMLSTPFFSSFFFGAQKKFEIKLYLFACWRVYGILRTFVPGPKHPLANKLFDMFGVNHGAEWLWPIPWHVAWGCPNQVHRRHPHTMGDDSCTWFGVISSTARVGWSVTQRQKCYGWDIDDVADERQE